MTVNVDVDYLEASSWDGAMPERLRWLREHDPVHWSERSGVWVITKFDDVAAVSKNQEVFTSGEGVRPGRPVKIGLIDEPEPRHGLLRGLINKGFTPRMVRTLEQRFREATREVVDCIAAVTECDFVEDVAVPLPLTMIAEMIGIRKEDRAQFHRWSDAMIAADGNYGDPTIMAASTQAFLEYSEYVTEIIENRRRNPADDLVSILVGANDRGELRSFGLDDVPGVESAQHLELANNELLLLLVILMVAGNETTRNAMSGGMQLLIENPRERQRLLDDPALLPSAIEEMVRMVSPVLSFGRTITRDTELRGRALRKGQQVLLVYPSANRDPDAFEDPDTFRVDRNPSHLGFGIGSHFCLGANLARMEMRVLFEELLRRIPVMEYAAGGPRFRPSALVRSCTEMRVRYDPEPGRRLAGVGAC